MNRREIVYKGIARAIGFTVDRYIHNKIDAEATEKGPQAGCKVLFSEKNAPVPSWDGNEEATKEILSNPEKAILMVSNHPRFIEPLVFLSTLPPRKNTTIIARGGTEYYFGRKMEQYFIPVYHKSFLETKKQKQKRQEKNTTQMNEVIRRIKNNEAVLIAPDGGRDRGNNVWKKGSAQLIEAALEMDEAYLVMGHIPKSNRFEQIDLFLQHNLKRPVRISEAINVKTLPIPNDIRTMPHSDKEKLYAISKTMKDYYENWTNTTQQKKGNNENYIMAA